MQMTGAQIFTEVLLEQGVEVLFGYPGAAVINLYDALYQKQGQIRHVLTAHEQGAAHAADGYARLTGKTGVVLATSGPGATNLVTGIASAFMDSVPMVAITGNVSTDLIGRDSFQEVYITGITMPITKHNFVISSVEELADTLRQAFFLAQSGRKGPVLVDIPKNITFDCCEFSPQAQSLPKGGNPVELKQAAEIAARINAAQRPLLLIGGGAAASGAGEYIEQLWARAQIPAVHTMMACGVLPSTHPANLGMVGMHGEVVANRAVMQADLILALGTRFSDRVAIQFENFAPQAAILQVDIDRSEINKNVPVALGMTADVSEALRAILPQITECTHPLWQKQLARLAVQETIEEYNAERGISPKELMKTVSELTGKDAVYTTDVGQHQLWAAKYLNHIAPRHFLTSGGLGAMGFGYGAAIGAKLAAPEVPVIHITGDGSFHMNLIEGATAVGYRLPVITIICNNRVLGMVRQWQKALYGGRYSQTQPGRTTDFITIARGYGALGFRCNTLAEFREAFAEALKADGPVWIDCAIDPEERVLPMIPPGENLDAMIIE